MSYLSDLHKNALAGLRDSEKQLFQELSARFTVFARHRIRNNQDAEEVVQKALTKIFGSYKTTEITTSFEAWALRILNNKVIDHFRTRKVHEDRISDSYDPGWTVDNSHSLLQLKEKLLDCLKKVNAINRKHARMLVLKYQGFKIDDICRRLQLKKGNAYSILSRARSQLELCLKKGDVK